MSEKQTPSVSFGKGFMPIFSEQSNIPKFIIVNCLFLNGKRIFIPGNVTKYNVNNGRVSYHPVEWGGAIDCLYNEKLVEGNPLLNFFDNQEVRDVIQNGGTMEHDDIQNYIKGFPECVELIKHCLYVKYDTNHILGEDFEVLDEEV